MTLGNELKQKYQQPLQSKLKQKYQTKSREAVKYVSPWIEEAARYQVPKTIQNTIEVQIPNKKIISGSDIWQLKTKNA